MNKTAELLKKQNGGKIVSFEGPVCPYCNQKSVLREESFVYKTGYTGKNYWVCANYPTCHSYVGTHGYGIWMNFPLGRLANSELRKLKSNAHALFDQFWKTKTIDRGKMYAWLREKMNLTEPEAHIGEMNEEQCHELIQHLNNLFDIVKIKTS